MTDSKFTYLDLPESLVKKSTQTMKTSKAAKDPHYTVLNLESNVLSKKDAVMKSKEKPIRSKSNSKDPVNKEVDTSKLKEFFSKPSTMTTTKVDHDSSVINLDISHLPTKKPKVLQDSSASLPSLPFDLLHQALFGASQGLSLPIIEFSVCGDHPRKSHKV